MQRNQPAMNRCSTRKMLFALLGVLACCQDRAQHAFAQSDPAATGKYNGYFVIQLLDDQTGRPVPLVELRAVTQKKFYTDSNGLVAFNEPGLMGQKVFFYIKSHGYEFPADGFGFHGTAVTPQPNQMVTLKIHRVQLAERLYRVTGYGIYRDSVLAGIQPRIEEGILNAQVFGSDSVVNAIFNGKLYWFWGDTNRPGYPLGTFDVPGAVSDLPAQGGLDPLAGVNLQYFPDGNGFVKGLCQMPGSGPTWMNGLVTLPDANGREHMLGTYVKVKPPLDIYERGICEFNQEKSLFEQRAVLPKDPILFGDQQPVVAETSGGKHVYFATPFPFVRAPATYEGYLDHANYEAYTCLETGSTLDAPQVERDETGQPVYRWRKNAPAVDPGSMPKLIAAKALAAGEGLVQLRDAKTGSPFWAHGGSVFWNAYRNKYVMIALERYGASMLGEIWYAEADTLLGPWCYAVKVVTHDRYSFYNPKQHPYFDQEGGAVIFFEGTYTSTFSGNEETTPLYDYNQIMCRLDLRDARTHLPQAVYVNTDPNQDETLPRFQQREPFGKADDNRQVAFFAHDTGMPERVAVYAEPGDSGMALVAKPAGEQASANADAKPLFYGLPVTRLAEEAGAASPLVPLHEFVHAIDGTRTYSTQTALDDPHWARTEAPVCLVWKSPLSAWPINVKP